jgi:hypothetical protein
LIVLNFINLMSNVLLDEYSNRAGNRRWATVVVLLPFLVLIVKIIRSHDDASDTLIGSESYDQAKAELRAVSMHGRRMGHARQAKATAAAKHWAHERQIEKRVQVESNRQKFYD